MSKIKQALALVAQGVNPHAAAVQTGCAATHVYQALKRERDKAAGVCHCCGQKLPGTPVIRRDMPEESAVVLDGRYLR